jgi:hypothetical protein
MVGAELAISIAAHPMQNAMRQGIFHRITSRQGKDIWLIKSSCRCRRSSKSNLQPSCFAEPSAKPNLLQSAASS